MSKSNQVDNLVQLYIHKLHHLYSTINNATASSSPRICEKTMHHFHTCLKWRWTGSWWPDVKSRCQVRYGFSYHLGVEWGDKGKIQWLWTIAKVGWECEEDPKHWAWILAANAINCIDKAEVRGKIDSKVLHSQELDESLTTQFISVVMDGLLMEEDAVWSWWRKTCLRADFTWSLTTV